MNNPYLKFSPDELDAMIAAEEAKEQSNEIVKNPYLNVPKEQLDAMIAEEEAKQLQQETSYGKEALRQVGRTGRGIATGIAGLADIPNLASMGLHAAGLKEDPLFYQPVSQRVQEKIDEITSGKLKPRSRFERAADAVVEGIAPLALAPLTGGASLTGTLARNIAGTGAKKGIQKSAEKLASLGAKTYAPTAGNLAGSAGSSLAMQQYLDENEDPSTLAALAAGLAGGVGAQVAPKAIKSIGKGIRHPIQSTKNTAASLYAKRLGIDPEQFARYEELGISPTAGHISKKHSTKAREEILRHHPSSRDEFSKSYMKREEEIAKNLGVSEPEDLKRTVRNIDKSIAKHGAEGYKKRVGDIFEHYQDKFKAREEQAINNRELVNVSDIHKKLSEGAKGLKKSKELKDFEKTQLGHFRKQIEDYSESVLTSKDISDLRKQGFPDDLIAKMGNSDKLVGYAGLEALRREAKSLRDNAKRGTPEYRDSSYIYDMLSRKRHDFMEQTGSPIEKHAAKKAREVYRQYASKGEKNLKKYIFDITESLNDASAFEKLVSKDPKYLHVTRMGLPKDEQKMLAESVIEHLGKQQGRFNINHAYTRWAKLEPGVQSEFLLNLSKPERKNFLGTMDLIGENKHVMENIANVSRSAHTSTSIKAREDIMSQALKGNIKGVMEQLFKNGLYRLDAKAYTDPIFLKRMNDMAKAQTSKSLANHTNLLLKSPVFRHLSRQEQQNHSKD